MNLITLPTTIAESYTVVKSDPTTGKDSVKLIACAAFGKLTGLRGKDLNRKYDLLKKEFNGAFKAAAHSAIDRMQGVAISQSKTRFQITLGRPKNTALELRKQAEALLAAAEEAAASEGTLQA